MAEPTNSGIHITYPGQSGTRTTHGVCSSWFRMGVTCSVVPVPVTPGFMSHALASLAASQVLHAVQVPEQLEQMICAVDLASRGEERIHGFGLVHGPAALPFIQPVRPDAFVIPELKE